VTQIGLEPRPMGTLVDRLAAFLEESAEEVAALESRREELESERAERIVAIREEYAERIKAVDEELATVRKLKHALEGPKPKAPKVEPQRRLRTPDRAEEIPGVSDRVKLATLKAIADGADVSLLIADAVGFSRGSVDNALPHLRREGFIRLTGERRISPEHHSKARTYAVTPEGEAYLQANLSTNGTNA
jgi:hypothetical protein